MIEFLIFLVLLVPFVIFIVMLVKLVQLSGDSKQHAKRLRALEEEVARMQRGQAEEYVSVTPPREARAASAPQAASTQAASPAAIPDAQPAVAQSETPVAAPPSAAPAQPSVAEAPASPATPPPAAARAPKPQPRPARTNAEWEQLIGGQWLNRIGAVALILGMGFFLKYAFDKNWIPEAARVLFGGAIGAGLLGLGWRFEKKGLQIFAQGLLGAGIAILYLSVYASFNFYHLVPQLAAFAMMSAVTLLTLLLAMRYDSLAISLLGWAGGFLTPIMLSTGVSNEAGLFTYVALLDAGLLAVLLRKERWIVLEPLTLLGTWVLFFSWSAEYYADSAQLMTIGFATLFWLLFFAVDLLRVRQAPSKYTVFHQILGAMNLVFFYPTLWNLVDIPRTHGWMPLVSLGLGAVYLAAWFALRRSGEEKDVAGLRLEVTAIVFAFLAVPQHFKNFAVVSIWAGFGLLLAWNGRRRRELPVWISALAMLAVAFLMLLGINEAFAYVNPAAYHPVLNLRLVAFLSLAVACIAGALFFDGGDDAAAKPVSAGLRSLGALLLFLLLTVETSDLFRTWMEGASDEMAGALFFFLFLTLAVLWAAYGLALAWTGLRTKQLPWLTMGLGSIFLALAMGAVRGIAFDPIAWFTPVVNFRSAALILLLAALFVLMLMSDRNKDAFPWLGKLQPFMSVAVVAMLFVLLTGETRDYFEKDLHRLYFTVPQPDSNVLIAGNQNLKQLSLSGIWLLYSIGLMVYGFLRRMRLLRISAFVLFGFSILKIFIYDLSYLETLYRIFSFIGLGVILLVVSYLFTKYKDVVFGEEVGK